MNFVFTLPRKPRGGGHHDAQFKHEENVARKVLLTASVPPAQVCWSPGPGARPGAGKPGRELAVSRVRVRDTQDTGTNKQKIVTNCELCCKGIGFKVPPWCPQEAPASLSQPARGEGSREGTPRRGRSEVGAAWFLQGK